MSAVIWLIYCVFRYGGLLLIAATVYSYIQVHQILFPGDAWADVQGISARQKPEFVMFLILAALSGISNYVCKIPPSTSRACSPSS